MSKAKIGFRKVGVEAGGGLSEDDLAGAWGRGEGSRWWGAFWGEERTGGWVWMRELMRWRR
jgi:hypothetical protein